MKDFENSSICWMDVVQVHSVRGIKHQIGNLKMTSFLLMSILRLKLKGWVWSDCRSQRFTASLWHFGQRFLKEDLKRHISGRNSCRTWAYLSNFTERNGCLFPVLIVHSAVCRHEQAVNANVKSEISIKPSSFWDYESQTCGQASRELGSQWK